MKHIIINSNAELSFAGLRYCEQRALLIRLDGGPVYIRKKSLDVFRLLAQRYNCVVTREEIFNIVWANKVVTDDSLVQCICEIRKLLGCQANETLKTFPRRGYALIPDQCLQAPLSDKSNNLTLLDFESFQQINE